MRNIVMFGPNGELLAEFNRQGVRFLIVGSVAVHHHAPERKYDDLDILIDPSPLNAGRCVTALQKLGLNPLFLAPQLAEKTDFAQALSLRRCDHACRRYQF